MENFSDICNSLQINNTIFCKCRDGAGMCIFEESDESVFEKIKNSFSSEGFEKIESKYLGGNYFDVFFRENITVYISYSPNERIVRAVEKTNAVTPKNQGFSGSKKYSPLVTQLSLPYYRPDCGMSYLIRLNDGRFVIIDGGFDEYESVCHLWDVISSQNERGGKPIIAAWFVSHAHDDHCGIPAHFIESYGEKVVLENVLYNWAVFIDGSAEHAEVRFVQITEQIKDKTNIVVPRTGQQFTFGDAVFDVLFVGEDLYPAAIPSLNNSSMVVKMTLNSKIVLFPGDAEAQASDLICKRYPKEYLKCDILQVAHHGYYGGSEDFYKAADPEILFWPCPNYWYPVVKEWGANPMLLSSPSTKAVFISGRMEKTVDLSLPFTYDDDPYREFASGETVYSEDFPENRRVAELGWSCLTGGHTGYGAAEINLKKGECSLCAGDRYDVIEFVQQGLLEKNPDYILTIEGKTSEELEYFGLFYDYLLPTVFSDEYAFDFKLNKTEEFKIVLKTDSVSKKAYFSVNDSSESVLPFRSIGGLHLILKNASVIINKISVKRSI